MTAFAPDPTPPLFVALGDNPARAFAMDAGARAAALAAKAGMVPAADATDGDAEDATDSTASGTIEGEGTTEGAATDGATGN